MSVQHLVFRAYQNSRPVHQRSLVQLCHTRITCINLCMSQYRCNFHQRLCFSSINVLHSWRCIESFSRVPRKVKVSPFLALCQSPYTVKQLLRKSRSIKINCARPYTKGTDENSESSSPVDSVLHNDPELNKILNQIKTDFSDKTKDSEVSSESGKENVKDLNIEADLKLADELDSVENDYSFYEVAQDIEEYDYKTEADNASQQIQPDRVPVVSLERGVSGVFDLDELLVLLEDLGAENVVTIPIPEEANFCEHMVIASAKSQRHMKAINSEMLWTHKRKKGENDPHLKVEGLENNHWTAMDLGNIVLHVFLGHARDYYDLESLWTLGPENDPKCQGQGDDKYALSAEDLFWLEAEQQGLPLSESESENKPAVELGADKDEKFDFTEQDAGWNASSGSPISKK